MILKKLKIQNFRSFGNNINEINFDIDKGNLILMVGGNGNGKSSIQFSIDYAMFGEIKNNNKKIKNSSLPNRFNGNMMVELDFESNGRDINVLRKLNPNLFVVKIDNEEIERSGKYNIQDKLDEYLEFDMDSWKSFISMSINDFKNFISLNNEEKKMLLDKLFNLELIDEISKILKEKKRLYKQECEKFDAEINSYQSSLDMFKNSIEKLKESDKKNIEEEKIELKDKLNSKKDEYLKLNDKLNKCLEKEVELKNKINIIKETTTELKFQINNCKEKIELYNSGICPMCNNNLNSETYDSYRNELSLKLDVLEKMKNELSLEYNDINDKQKKLSVIKNETDKTFSELKFLLKSLKDRINLLENKDDKDIYNNIDELYISINKIEERKIDSSKKLIDVKKEEMIYDDMIKLFSNDNIKKSIISKIITPINLYIKENLDMMNMNIRICLDSNFNAVIQSMGEEIDSESLSTGESKKANIAIMLAYLKLIRLKRHTNILFLDEVFSSIDITSIYDVLNMLRNFAHIYKINIFLIHHAMLEKSYFDKVYRIEKSLTSNIIEE